MANYDFPYPAFLKEIPHEFILYHINNKGKKVYDERTITKGFTYEQIDALRQDHQTIGCMFYLKDTDYAVVDIDTDDYSIQQLIEDSGIDSCYVKGNTKGYHIYVRFENGKDDIFKTNKQNCMNKCKGDWLGEKSLERVGKEWYGEHNGDYIVQYIDPEMFASTFDTKRFVYKNKSPKLKIVNKNNNDDEPFNTDEIEGVQSTDDDKYIKLLECCKNRALSGEHSNWINIGQVLKNELKDNANKYFIEWTYKYGSENKKEECIDTITKYIHYTPLKNKDRLSIASLHYWAKQDNPELYNKYFKDDMLNDIKDILLTNSDTDYAILFNKLTNNRHRCIDTINKICYSFDIGKKIWIENNGTIIKNEITSILYPFFNNIYKKCKNEKSEKIVECIKKVKTASCKKNIFSEIIEMNYDVDQELEQMNKKINYISIKGGKILNIEDMTIRDRTIDDYFDFECDCDFIPYDEKNEKFKYVDKYFNDLFCNNQKTKNCFMDIIKSCLSGKTLRYIYFMTGSGMNGKSLLLNLLSTMLKKNVDTLSKLIMVKQKGNYSSSINSEIEKTTKCRIGIMSELEETDVLNRTTLKEITGGDKIDYRGLFKGNKTIIPTTNIFCATNELPKFKAEKATIDRLIIIPFNNTFKKNSNFEKELLEHKDYIFSYILQKGSIKDVFDLSEEMYKSLEDYVDDNSEKLEEFISDMVIREENKKGVNINEFRNVYDEWCKINKYKIDTSTKNIFTRKIEKYFKTKKSSSKRKILDIILKELNYDSESEED